jgi:DNA replication protein DnaC
LADPCPKCAGLGYLPAEGRRHARVEGCECVRDCPDCRGDRYRVVTRDGYDFAEPCHCQSTWLRVAAFNEAELPADYGKKTLQGYIAEPRNRSQEQAKNRLLKYLREFDAASSGGLLLVGGTGTGKTHLLCALLSDLTLRQGHRAAYVDFSLLTSRIRATFDDPTARGQEDIIGPLSDVPVLALDELGRGVRTEWELSVFDELVTRRYNAGLVVLGATNYLPASLLDAPAADPAAAPAGRRKRSDRDASTRPPESLEERIGQRAWSRLAETTTLVTIEAGDYRTRAASR